jgi:glycosyltransferase involved in cell wall biosynthesis
MPGADHKTVLFINHWAAHLGGAEHSLADILAAMAGRCDCHLVTTEDGALVQRAGRAGVSCHVAPCAVKRQGFRRDRLVSSLLASLPDLVAFVKYVVLLRALVKRVAPSVIHANVPKSHVALFCLSLSGYRGACCFHVRELFSRGSVPAMLYALLFPRRNASVIAISHAVKHSLPKRMQAAGTVIYNGVEVLSQPRTSLGGSGRAVGFLYCGRIVPWKGCHLLVEMFSDARKALPDTAMELTMVGDTSYWTQEYRTRLSRLIRDRGLEACCFLKPDTDDVGRLYSANDVFVNASFREPFGRSIAEAQGAGLPVVAFDSGGVAEIVVHNATGFLAAWGDRDAFVKGMADCARDPLRAAALGEAGRRRAETLFNRDVQVPKICGYILGGNG